MLYYRGSFCTEAGSPDGWIVEFPITGFFPKHALACRVLAVLVKPLARFGDPLAEPAIPKRRHTRYLVSGTLKNT